MPILATVPALLAVGLTAGGAVLLGCGLAVLVGAAAWRFAQTVNVRRRIRATLTDPDPALRRHGIALATDRGLASSADMLLDVARDERDPTVLAALVHAIARRQWEPASTPRIVELRLWAKAYVDMHDELRGGYEDVLGTASAVPAEPAATFGDRPARRATDATAARLAALGVDTDGEPAVRVLVTGAGGPAGVAVIRDLLAHGHHVIAVDADESAVGVRLASEGHRIPPADDPEYGAELWKVVTLSEPQALICTVAEEYAALRPHVERLTATGVATLLPSAEAVADCVDKWRFAQLATRRGLPAPHTALGRADGVAGPAWVVKPRFGRGSRDVHVVEHRDDLAAALRATPDPIVQQRAVGREFTADALVDRDGTVLAVVPRWRLETKAGISTKGCTFDDPAVTAAVERVLTAVKLIGPANVQGFVADDGGVCVHEVNPRFSGGLPLSLHAGAELVGEYLRLVLGRPVRRERLVARADVMMYRHFAEVFEG